MGDDLHEFKTGLDLPGQGITEAIENQFKKVTPALGLSGFSQASGKIATNIGVLADHYSGGKVMENVDDNFLAAFNSQLLIVPDWITNILLIAGVIITVATDKTTLIPMGAIIALYFAIPQAIRSLKLL